MMRYNYKKIGSVEKLKDKISGKDGKSGSAETIGRQDQRKVLEDRIRGKYWKIGSEESIGRQDQWTELEERTGEKIE